MIQTIRERITPPSPPRASILPTYADLIRSGELTVEQAIEAMNNPAPSPEDDLLVAGLKRDMKIAQAIDEWCETALAARTKETEPNSFPAGVIFAARVITDQESK